MSDSPRNGSLLVIFLTVFVDLLGFGMVLPLLPIYAKQFGVDEHGMLTGLLMCSFSAMQFVFAPLWGRLSDRIGRRPVLMVGLGGSVLFYAMFGVASSLKSLPLLFAARIGAGIAGATISTAQAYIADTTSLENRTKGMALIGAAFGMGFTFGPLIGALAVRLTGASELSPLPGFVASLLSAVALGLAIFMLPESLNAASRPAAHRWWNLTAWRDALGTPSVGALLLVSFISVMAFGGFETTLSLLLVDKESGFGFKLDQVLFVFAYIGVVLSLVQGGIVRRVAGRVREPALVATGGLLTIAGFLLVMFATNQHSLTWMLVATAVQVSGFAFMTPSLQSLISRRSDPAKQGSVLGVSQSVSALARIAAPVAIPLFYIRPDLPYWVAIGLMAAGLLLLATVARHGQDFASAQD